MTDNKQILWQCNDMTISAPSIGKIIVRDISISIEKGKHICIMGESGAGKTTIVNHIAGFKKKGLYIETTAAFRKEDLIVFSVCQDADFFLDPYKRLYYYIKKAFSRRFINRPKNGRKIDFALLLDYVHQLGLLKPLFEDKKNYGTAIIENVVANGTKQEKEKLGLVLRKALKTKTKQKLSGGEKQKFFLLLGLIVNPDILVADEIFADIDSGSQKRISQLIFQQDFTVIFVSHQIKLVKELMMNGTLSCTYYLRDRTFAETWVNTGHHPPPDWAKKMIEAYESLLDMGYSDKTQMPGSVEEAQVIYHIHHARKVFHDGRMVDFYCSNGGIRLYKGINYAFVGENGAGKTTLFKILTKLYDYKGEIFYTNGNSFTGLKKIDRLDFVFRNQLVFQKTGNAVDDNKPVMDYLLSYFIKQERSKAQIQIKDIVNCFFTEEKVETILNSPFYDLSVGEQRRILLIQGLLMVDKDGIIFIDEAMRGMDVFLKKKLVNYLKQKQQQVFLITHDNVLVNALCHQYILFEFQNQSQTTFLSGPFDISQPD